MRAAIIDYGMGNIRSVFNALKYVGFKPVIAEKPQEAYGDILIIPGVGGFGDGIKNIEPFKNAILEHVDSGKPLLGICLGLQMLFEASEEDPGKAGLGLMKGKIVKIRTKYKLPHIGWNRVHIRREECPLLKGLEDGYAYFVHSYHAAPNENVVAAITDYGCEVTAAVWKGNLYGLQFHPERSGRFGLEILKNLLRLDKNVNS